MLLTRTFRGQSWQQGQGQGIRDEVITSMNFTDTFPEFLSSIVNSEQCSTKYKIIVLYILCSTNSVIRFSNFVVNTHGYSKDTLEL